MLLDAMLAAQQAHADMPALTAAVAAARAAHLAQRAAVQEFVRSHPPLLPAGQSLSGSDAEAVQSVMAGQPTADLLQALQRLHAAGGAAQTGAELADALRKQLAAEKAAADKAATEAAAAKAAAEAAAAAAKAAAEAAAAAEA